MSIISFVIFATVALVTVLFSLFLGIILSRRKSANFDLSYGNQLLRYTIEENHNQNYNSNNRISEYDESEYDELANLETQHSEPQVPNPMDQVPEVDPYYSLSKRNFTIAGSRVITVKPSKVAEPVFNRQIRLQFK